MEQSILEFVEFTEAGFRLERLEVYNWGTFHGKIWSIKPGGKTSLLTGDIGSGKSTLVDAITTLLVPAHRVAYNKAAGAEAGERTLRSYVLGYYKAARSDDRLSAKPIALRDHNSYTVILGYFRNADYNQEVTLAQVFWQPDGQGQPNRFYVVGEKELSIAEHFTGFGSDLSDLRKRLRNESGVKVFDHFPQYGAHFRRLLGIESEQALELFHQTISMKSVGNLTDFVREHMIESFPVEERIEALIRHFEDLDKAYRAVLKAKKQIEMLQPLANDLERHDEATQKSEELKGCREALSPWFALMKADLLKERMERLGDEIERSNLRIEGLERIEKEQRNRRDELQRAIAESGGERIAQLEQRISELASELRRREERFKEYHALVHDLGLDRISDSDGFVTNLRAAEAEKTRLEDERAQIQNALMEAAVALKTVRDDYDRVQVEITSLRSRPTNIPSHMLQLRSELCASLDLREDEVPFIGELIEVREDEKEWEGAIERLLHNFGLSLLVADRHYKAVAEWVDRTHLKGRLIYYRTRPTRDPSVPEIHPDSVVRKLSIRHDTEFYTWLEQELAHRFNYLCCRDMNRFRREPRALTRAGQIKGRDGRHEKDDRYAIDDRTRYILGWSNERKIEALEKQARSLERRMQDIAREYGAAQEAEKALRGRFELLIRFEGFRHFEEIDWRSSALQKEQLEQELRALTAASDRLRTLKEQLATLEDEMRLTADNLLRMRDERSRRVERFETAKKQLKEAQRELVGASKRLRSYFPRLEEYRQEAIPTRRITVESADNVQREMREWLQARIDTEGSRLKRIGERIIKAMGEFRREWPLETQEIDVSVEAGSEYRALLQRLLEDDLPRFEARFRDLLRRNTIREVANFQAHLNREAELIIDRVNRINESLYSIDYNPTHKRYIVLQAEETPDVEIREFREALRACTEGALTGSEDDQYSERKFAQVKAIIERFQGREGYTDIDKRWTRKVTDVRNWFVFSASERWREDDTEYEHYTDTGGKSGGQKEKLAYTVLAASLAYQFGLDSNTRRSRSFRFVAIDEAFGRGSDESARYALELFRKLNLQLLVVTPLQKIHVIEPFVSSVAFVYNQDDRNSMIRNLTIEEYQAEKAAYGQIAKARVEVL